MTGTVENEAVARLVRRLAGLPPGDAVGQVRSALLVALADPAVSELYHGRDTSYLVWAEPGGCTVHASVHRPGHVTSPHDHGSAWAVYGVVRGPTSFTRWTRSADIAPGVAGLGPPERLELAAGAAEVVLPGQVHAVANHTDDLTWNLVVRSRSLAEIARAVFDVDSGAYRVVSPFDRARARSSDGG